MTKAPLSLSKISLKCMLVKYFFSPVSPVDMKWKKEKRHSGSILDKWNCSALRRTSGKQIIFRSYTNLCSAATSGCSSRLGYEPSTSYDSTGSSLRTNAEALRPKMTKREQKDFFCFISLMSLVRAVAFKDAVSIVWPIWLASSLSKLRGEIYSFKLTMPLLSNMFFCVVSKFGSLLSFFFLFDMLAF